MSDLQQSARIWVIDHYGHQAQHLVKAEEWLQRIDPNASEAMLLAILTHDMERAFPGPDSPKMNPTLKSDDPGYNNAHSERSARIVSEFLQEQGAATTFIDEVAALIRVHEFGGWAEANWVQAADSLSFLEVNVDLFIHNIDIPQSDWDYDRVHEKFEWMYQRIQIPAARQLATPYYQEAMRKLRAKREQSRQDGENKESQSASQPA